MQDRYGQSRPRIRLEVEVRPLKATRAGRVMAGMWTAEGLLSTDECASLIASCAPHIAPVDWEYVASYRSCQRAVVMCEALAAEVAQRLRPLWTRADLEGVRPFGHGTQGTWVLPPHLKVVNPCWRVSETREGQFFARHRDSGFVITNDYRSIFTVLVYLNDDFAGGDTVFYDTQGTAYPLRPACGTAVVFLHDLFHEGTPVTRGIKWVARSDVLFQRVAPLPDDPSNFPAFQEAHCLYKRSIELQQQGKPHESTQAFLAAGGPSSSPRARIVQWTELFPVHEQYDRVALFYQQLQLVMPREVPAQLGIVLSFLVSPPRVGCIVVCSKIMDIMHHEIAPLLIAVLLTHFAHRDDGILVVQSVAWYNHRCIFKNAVEALTGRALASSFDDEDDASTPFSPTVDQLMWHKSSVALSDSLREARRWVATVVICEEQFGSEDTWESLYQTFSSYTSHTFIALVHGTTRKVPLCDVAVWELMGLFII